MPGARTVDDSRTPMFAFTRWIYGRKAGGNNSKSKVVGAELSKTSGSGRDETLRVFVGDVVLLAADGLPFVALVTKMCIPGRGRNMHVQWFYRCDEASAVCGRPLTDKSELFLSHYKDTNAVDTVIGHCQLHRKPDKTMRGRVAQNSFFCRRKLNLQTLSATESKRIAFCGTDGERQCLYEEYTQSSDAETADSGSEVAPDSTAGSPQRSRVMRTATSEPTKASSRNTVKPRASFPEKPTADADAGSRDAGVDIDGREGSGSDSSSMAEVASARIASGQSDSSNRSSESGDEDEVHAVRPRDGSGVAMVVDSDSVEGLVLESVAEPKWPIKDEGSSSGASVSTISQADLSGMLGPGTRAAGSTQSQLDSTDSRPTGVIVSSEAVGDTPQHPAWMPAPSAAAHSSRVGSAYQAAIPPLCPAAAVASSATPVQDTRVDSAGLTDTVVPWSEQETQQLLKLLVSKGKKWAAIAEHIPGRSVGEVIAQYYLQKGRNVARQRTVQGVNGAGGGQSQHQPLLCYWCHRMSTQTYVCCHSGCSTPTWCTRCVRLVRRSLGARDDRDAWRSMRQPGKPAPFWMCLNCFPSTVTPKLPANSQSSDSTGESCSDSDVASSYGGRQSKRKRGDISAAPQGTGFRDAAAVLRTRAQKLLHSVCSRYSQSPDQWRLHQLSGTLRAYASGELSKDSLLHSVVQIFGDDQRFLKDFGDFVPSRYNRKWWLQVQQHQ